MNAHNYPSFHKYKPQTPPFQPDSQDAGHQISPQTSPSLRYPSAKSLLQPRHDKPNKERKEYHHKEPEPTSRTSASGFQSLQEFTLDQKLSRTSTTLQDIQNNDNSDDIGDSTVSSSEWVEGFPFHLSRDHLKQEKEQSIASDSCNRQATPMLWQQPQCPQKQMLHPGIQCDLCHQLPIQGIRYQCQKCQDFDMCQRCLETGKHSHRVFEVHLKPKIECKRERMKAFLQHESSQECLKFKQLLSKFQGLIS